MKEVELEKALSALEKSSKGDSCRDLRELVSYTHICTPTKPGANP